jgi:dihydroorotate dehydrogenase (fumarate)
MADLKTSYMGMELDNPIVVSSSGITGSIEGVKRCVDAGAGAVVLKSMFEELILAQSDDIEQDLSSFEHPEALDYVRAEIGMRLGPLPYLEFIEEARKSVSVPVMASVNCVTPNWWVPYAKRIESAGASALELNISHFPRSTEGEDSGAIEKRYTEIVQKVSKSVSIPVAVKLGFYFTSLWDVIEDVVRAGAKALVLFNRYYAVDVDLDNRIVVPAVKLSAPAEMLLPLRWVGLAAGKLDCDVAVSTGIHDGRSIAKALMMGANVVQVCSALYRNGPEYVDELKSGLSSWLDEEKFGSVEEIRGLAMKNTKEEGNLLNRLQYVKALEEASKFYKF